MLKTRKKKKAAQHRAVCPEATAQDSDRLADGRAFLILFTRFWIEQLWIMGY
jgi:hypothetical protein